MTGLLLFVLAGLAAMSWWHLMKGKERARRAAAVACHEHGLLLMDDTVVFDAVQLGREGDIRAYGLKYRFDFARNGILHHGGSVLIAPGRPATVVIRTRDGHLIEEVL